MPIIQGLSKKRINPLDLNKNVTIGVAFPLDDVNMFQGTETVKEQIKSNLINLLLTYPGERVHQPEFGSRLRAFCFEQLDDSLPTRIEEEIKRTVGNWLPYINIIEVETLTEEGDKNKIFVKLKYSTILTPESMQQITLDTSYTATIY